ncbi:AzlD domain-containing protein [Geobacillus jurassicus]|uniref:AzlD domain-containing protein n=1 Tax=Geobacillus jurassicus TaxID=235932 RepID=A0ABV6GXC8_9BACL|nr:AzlD domain-containing protein [Geobacillus jurassicus]
MNSTIVWMIIGMGVVTYLPRLLPFVLLGRVKLPPFWQGVLKNVPYAVLGALIIPDVFFIQDDLWFGVIGFAAAVITAWLGANVMIVVLAAVAALSLYSFFV